MLLIRLSGPPACGKTHVSRLIEEHGDFAGKSIRAIRVESHLENEGSAIEAAERDGVDVLIIDGADY